MKFLLILLLIQNLPPNLDWKLIKEMSGDIFNQKGLTANTYAARIARGNELVKLSIRIDYPQGAPVSVFKDHAPRGFDISSIASMVFRIELNCKTLTIKPKGGGEVYQFNGKRHKSKEVPFKIESSHILAVYFCEQGEAPTKAPTLKP